MATAILLTLLLTGSPVTASPSPELGIVIIQKTMSESATPAGLQKSQALTEFQLLGNMARQDVYIGGVKGNPRTHTTVLYFPDRKELVSIVHATDHCAISGEATLEEQKRLLREIAVALPKERPKLTSTGEIAHIEGQEAVKYTGKSQTMSFTYWFVEDERLVAAGKLHHKLISTPAGELGSLQFPDPATFPGYPVRVVLVQDHSGIRVTSNTTSEVRFDVQIDPSVFEVPKGCRLND